MHKQAGPAEATAGAGRPALEGEKRHNALCRRADPGFSREGLLSD